jgi:hypothetical protein
MCWHFDPEDFLKITYKAIGLEVQNKSFSVGLLNRWYQDFNDKPCLNKSSYCLLYLIRTYRTEKEQKKQ